MISWKIERSSCVDDLLVGCCVEVALEKELLELHAADLLVQVRCLEDNVAVLEDVERELLELGKLFFVQELNGLIEELLESLIALKLAAASDLITFSANCLLTGPSIFSGCRLMNERSELIGAL